MRNGRREAGRDPQTAWQSANFKRTRAAELLALVGPSAISALQAFKHMNHDPAFRFHDRFEESEPSCAETALMA
jgi:hypothetical protein